MLQNNEAPGFAKGFIDCRDDWIRTSDHTPPRRVRYRAALRPELGLQK